MGPLKGGTSEGWDLQAVVSSTVGAPPRMIRCQDRTPPPPLASFTFQQKPRSSRQKLRSKRCSCVRDNEAASERNSRDGQRRPAYLTGSFQEDEQIC